MFSQQPLNMDNLVSAVRESDSDGVEAIAVHLVYMYMPKIFTPEDTSKQMDAIVRSLIYNQQWTILCALTTTGFSLTNVYKDAIVDLFCSGVPLEKVSALQLKDIVNGLMIPRDPSKRVQYADYWQNELDSKPIPDFYKEMVQGVINDLRDFDYIHPLLHLFDKLKQELRSQDISDVALKYWSGSPEGVSLFKTLCRVALPKVEFPFSLTNEPDLPCTNHKQQLIITYTALVKHHLKDFKLINIYAEFISDLAHEAMLFNIHKSKSLRGCLVSLLGLRGYRLLKSMEDILSPAKYEWITVNPITFSQIFPCINSLFALERDRSLGRVSVIDKLTGEHMGTRVSDSSMTHETLLSRCVAVLLEKYMQFANVKKWELGKIAACLMNLSKIQTDHYRENVVDVRKSVLGHFLNSLKYKTPSTPALIADVLIKYMASIDCENQQHFEVASETLTEMLRLVISTDWSKRPDDTFGSIEETLKPIRPQSPPTVQASARGPLLKQLAQRFERPIWK